MVITDGKIEISDYSCSDERYKIVELLDKMGVRTEVEFDSWCG